MKKISALLLALVLVLSFAACGEKPETPSDPGESGSSQSQSEKGDSSSADKDDDFVIKTGETGDALIWKISDNTYFEIRHTGDKITSYKTYVAFGSANEAKENAKALQFYVTMDGSAIKSITSKGKYVVYEYTEEGFPYSDYASAKEAFDTYNSLVG